MTYLTEIEKSKHGLLLVKNAVGKYLTEEETRFLGGLEMNNFTEAKVRIMLSFVRERLSKSHRELLRLSEIEPTFNKQWATDHNDIFRNTQRLFWNVRSTLSGAKKIYKKFCPLVRKKQPAGMASPSVFVNSVLANGSCGRDLYGISSFSDSVQTLYVEMGCYFANVVAVLTICHRVIMEETLIGQDADKCLELFNEQCRKVLDGIESLKGIMVVKRESVDECVLIQRRNEAKSLKEFAKEGWHKHTPGEVMQYAFLTTVETDAANHQPAGTTLLFRSKEKGDDAQLLIDHFDELRPDNHKNHDGLKLRLYCNWCQDNKTDNPNKAYFLDLMEKYKGKKGFPDWHAVTCAKNRKGINMEEEQRKFNNEVETLLKGLKPEENSVLCG